MKKIRTSMFKKFRSTALEVVSRYRDKIISTAYVVGDGLVAVIPPVKAGLVGAFFDGHASWPSFFGSYGERALPPIASACMFVASCIMTRNLALGIGLQGVGVGVLMADLLHNGQFWSAMALSPALPAAVIGACRTPLTRWFGDHPNRLIRSTLGTPDRLVGFLFATTSVPTMISSSLEQDWGLFASGTSWTLGNGLFVFSNPSKQNEKPTRQAALPALKCD